MAENTNNKDEHIVTWASLCHFSALLGAVWWIPIGNAWIPCGQIIAPFAVWVMKRKTSPFVDLAGRQSLNFQFTLTAIGTIIGYLLGGFIAFVALWAIALFDLFCIIRGGVKSSEGKLYSYPIPTIPLLKTSKLWEDLSLKANKGLNIL